MSLPQIRDFCVLFNPERPMDLAELNRKFFMGEDANPDFNCWKEMWLGRSFQEYKCFTAPESLIRTP